MKKSILVLISLFVLGCSPSIQYYPGPQGPKGDTGTSGADGAAGATGSQGLPGANGHSVVTQWLPASWCECDEAGGSRLDVYLDLDDSLSLSEGDSFLNGSAICNGSNGLNGTNGLNGADGAQGVPGATGPQGIPGADGAIGPQGPQGLAGPVGPQGSPGVQGPTGPAGSSASVVALTSSSCTFITGSNGYYVKSGNLYDSAGCNSDDKVTLQVGESVWVATLMLVQRDSSGLRSIKFN